MEYLILGTQLMLSLSILVVIHEFGHFLPAKWFKTRVEKFYLFFDPYFSLVKKKIGETEWGIGWLPLGGYVKIAGMVDESMDKEQMQKEPEEWEFRAKPAWQRLIIMIGGVTMNMILAWVIYACLFKSYGEEYLPAKNATYGMICDSILLEHGFKDGDKLLRLEGKSIERIASVSKDVILGTARKFVVERNGAEKQIILPQNIDQTLLENGSKVLFQEAVPFFADSILPSGNAAKSQLQKQDQLIAVNGRATPFFQSFAKEVSQRKNEKINLTIIRNNSDTLTFPVEVSNEGKIGVANRHPKDYFDFEKIDHSFFSAITKGFHQSISVFILQAQSIPKLFSQAGAKQMGGFGAIASLFSTTWDWQVFWERTALISVLLAFMNLLPIPALDGGHVMFLLIEMITRRPVPQKVLEYGQVIGMVLLLSLVLFANGNDIVKSEWFQNLF